MAVGVVGKSTEYFINSSIETISNLIDVFLNYIGASKWLQSLIIDGIFKGISSVLSFIPQLVILFICISILETSGYMSRIAFLLDNIFRKFGLSGKTLIPFIIGSGCSVPGIMSTKIIENEKEQRMTAMLVPFIPCSAKLPIIALFSGYFFYENSGLICASLYFLSIVIILFSAILMKKYIFMENESAFIFELPKYKIPDLKYIINDVSEKVVSFIIRAGSTIFLASIIVWFLLNFSIELKYGINVEKSILAMIGKKLAWIFEPIIGTSSWEIAVSSLQGLIAKEQIVSSMSIIAGIEGENKIWSLFEPVSAYSFIVFNLFNAPCLATISTMKKEIGNWKYIFFIVLYEILIAWILSALIYIFLNN